MEERSLGSREKKGSTTSLKRGKNHLLLIGINKYPHFPPLRNAVKDIMDFKRILLGQYQFEEQYTRVLTNQAATREGIIDVLEQLVQDSRPEDNVLIYFSGHGNLNQKKTKGYWIPVDARPNKTSSYLSNTTVRDHISDLEAHHVLLISDACFARAMFAPEHKNISEVADRVEIYPSRWGVCSGRHEQVVSDGNPGANSPFASAILEFLVREREAKFPVSELVRYVVKATVNNYPQTPQGRALYGVGDKGGEFVFYKKEQPDLETSPKPQKPTPTPQIITKPSSNPILDEIEANMVFVRGGTFMMDSNDGRDNEKPVHEVTLDDFYISKYQVTQRQWQAVMGSNPSHFKSGNNHPVECVSWDDVQKFIQKLNAQTGQSYCLPTEAQWEYAARGGQKSKSYKYAGSNNLDKVAWYNTNSRKTTRSVGQKQANELGLYDMSGNVWEWCQDAYVDTFYQTLASTQRNPINQGYEINPLRVLRGGSRLDFISKCGVTYRFSVLHNYPNDISGFRLFRTP